MCKIKTAERERAAHKNAGRNVAIDMVPELVRHYGLDFIRGELPQQRVPQDNTTRVAQAH